jgi:hypothetical protein
MNERSGTVRLIEPRGESEVRNLVTTISRKEVEDALHKDAPVDLLLDVDRVAASGAGRESERIALAWEPQDLERLLAATSGDEITLSFDEGELQQLLDEDIEAHGMRETLAVLSVVAGIAAAGAGSATAAVYAGNEGGPSAATPAVVAPASEVSTGLQAPAPATTPSEVSTGLPTSAPATAPAATPSEISTGVTGEAPAAPAEISTGIVQEPAATPAEVTTGIGQQPTASPVSASPSDTSWAPSGAEIGAIAAGAILAIAAAGFAVRTQRRRPATA